MGMAAARGVGANGGNPVRVRNSGFLHPVAWPGARLDDNAIDGRRPRRGAAGRPSAGAARLLPPEFRDTRPALDEAPASVPRGFARLRCGIGSAGSAAGRWWGSAGTDGSGRGAAEPARGLRRGPALDPEPTLAQVLRVMCGRPRRSKGNLVCCVAVGCGHVSGLCCAALGPLALVQSAAWLPNRFTRWNGP
jgi:hypothetical protein